MPSLVLPLPPRAVDRRLVLVGLLLAAVALAFWTGSRYPALDEKAMMGGETPVEGLAFDVVVPVDPGAPALVRVGANAVNWAYTNKQGMTFGVLFAALVLTVLPLVTRGRPGGRMSGTLLGVAMGAPLGVCVNCAVPIAEGLHKGGSRPETTLAALMSSPTLNVVVLSMTFALFPVWLAGLRIGLTLAFIAVGVPLLVRLLWREAAPAPAPEALAAPGPELPAAPALAEALGPDAPPTTWAAAATWTVRSVAQNLWYIVRTTVPLMLVAGLLGAVAVTLLPWEALSAGLPALDPAGKTKLTLAALGAVALFGTFLPVPIAFDVILCAILAAAGVPVPYVAVLLVTLGLFSAYPALQIWRTMSRPTSAGLFLAVAALGLTAGWTAYYGERWYETRQELLLADLLVAGSEAAWERPAFPTDALAATDVAALLGPTAIAERPVAGPWPAGIAVSRSPLAAPAGGEATLRFTRVPGADLGIDEPSNTSILRLTSGFGVNRAAASGDVHGDGWPDVVFTSEAGVSLWANVGGERFVRQAIAVPALDTLYAVGAALVDLDGDGALDLFVATFDGGEHVVYNDGGAFTAAGHARLPRPADAAPSASAAFGDVDGDGDLDVVVGRAVGFNGALARGGTEALASYPAARNALLINGGGRGRFASRALEGIDGETLTVLLSDLDGDGDLDLVVGNDYGPPDVVYDGDGAGGFRAVRADEGRIPITTGTTMSVVSADLDNDLMPELFFAHISWERMERPSPETLCEGRPVSQHAACVQTVAAQKAMLRAHWTNTLSACLAYDAPDVRADCAALFELRAAERARLTGKRAQVFGGRQRADGPGACDRLATRPRWAFLHEQCAIGAAPPPPIAPDERAAALPSRPTTTPNVLLHRERPGPYAEEAEARGLGTTNWTWHTRFADFDHDGLLDLFVVNGWPASPTSGRDLLFRNVGGGRFEDATDAAGVGSWLDSFAATAVDFDRDGDLDLLIPTSLGPVDVLRNETAGSSVEVALRDDATANRFGIGAVVTARFADGTAQVREVQASGGFLTFDEPVAHFGLGAHGPVAALDVRWPTGERTRLAGPFAAGQRVTVRRSAR